MLLGNPFNSRPQNRLDFESQSENESHINDRENNEEGKSLMDDFNQRAPLQLSDSHRHNNSVDSEAHEEQNDQSNRSQNRIIFPQIISERSQQSQSSDFINVNSRNIRLINPLNSSNRSGSSISEQDNPRIEFMQINQQLSKDNSEEMKINQIVHESHNKSAPKLNPLKPNSFENKYNPFDSQSESNSRNNKLFQIESEAKTYEPIIPFHEYSNASKMIRSRPNNINVLPKLSFNKNNYLDTNYSKSFEIVKSSEKLQKLDKNQISFEQHKNCTNIDMHSDESVKFKTKNIGHHANVLNSPIEETKYLSLHQQTISDSILEEDDVPLRNFYQKNLDNIQTSKTLDEESKNNKEIKEDDLSRYPSKIEDGLFEKIDKIVNDGSIECIQHPKFMDDDIEINDNTFVFPNLDSARLKRNRLQPLKKEFFCTQKTELELTPQGIKDKHKAEENKNEQIASDKLITIEENDFRKESDFIFEKSLIESNELIEDIDLNITNEKMKLRKLKSRKLRRRQNVSKTKNIKKALTIFPKLKE